MLDSGFKAVNTRLPLVILWCQQRFGYCSSAMDIIFVPLYSAVIWGAVVLCLLSTIRWSALLSLAPSFDFQPQRVLSADVLLAIVYWDVIKETADLNTPLTSATLSQTSLPGAHQQSFPFGSLSGLTYHAHKINKQIFRTPQVIKSINSDISYETKKKEALQVMAGVSGSQDNHVKIGAF